MVELLDIDRDRMDHTTAATSDRGPSGLFRPRRTLASGGNFASASLLHRTWLEVGDIDVRTALDRALASFYRVSHVTTLESGSTSLYCLFRAIKERKGSLAVSLASYTCPDIVAAALCAGGSVTLIDVDETSLDLSPARAAEVPQVIVLSNLFGLVDRIEPWSGGALVVDDGCQGGLSEVDGVSVGARPNTVGVLSFGRGKALCGVGGGALLGSANVSDAATSGPGAELQGGMKWAISRVFEHPMLHWVPLGIPALGLGETCVAPIPEPRSISRVSALHALAQLRAAEETRREHRRRAELWHLALEGCDVVEPFVVRGGGGGAVPVRYPILFPSSAQRDRSLAALQVAGLGATASYGASLRTMLRRIGVEVAGSSERADRIAPRLLTLPVHRYVRELDIERGGDLIRRQC